MRFAKPSFLVFFLLWSGFAYTQGEFIAVGKDSIAIYLEDLGEGKPILFIPGWTMTSQFFISQKDYFSKKYRYLSYDPRSHGKSTKTANHNTYKNHAVELEDIIRKKKLQNVILVGWSSGCATIYEYVKAFGIENLSHLVFIDEPPKWIGDRNSEWVYGTFEGYRESLKGLIENRKDYAFGTANWMTAKDLDSTEADWMVNQMLMTPNDAALSLYIDGMISDYNAVVKGLDGKIPMLFMVQDSWYASSDNWLKQHVPNAKVLAIPSHAAFWEAPEQFNVNLESFITGH